MQIQVQRLDPTVPLPGYARADDAGADVCAGEDVLLQPGQRATIGTGLAVAVPPGYALLVHPRSGLAANHGITIVNAPGTVDAGYRGEIMVTLLNTDSAQPFQVRRGDRIAQFVVQRVEQVQWVPAQTLPETERGSGGFGSTGVEQL